MPRKKRESADEIAARLSTPTPRVSPIPPEDFLSCGVTPLNLASTGKVDAFIAKGTYVYFVGDSSSGKTWFSFSLLAEASRNSHFADYRFIYDNAENGALMDVGRYFGQGVVDRLEPPKGTLNDPLNSATVQEFFYSLDDALNLGPCIYILDSVDAVGALEEEEKFQEEKAAFEKGKEASGSFGISKAKYISRRMGAIATRLRQTKSILVLLSQTRDKIGGMVPNQKTRSGGKALKFYSHLELWTSVKGPIKRTVMKKEREVGNWINVDVQKNRFSGWEGKLTIPFHRSHGFDDLGACVDFLVDERYWSKDDKNKIAADEFDFIGQRESLIQHIESEGDERELRLLVAKVWRKIEEESSLDRKPKYA